MEETGVRLVATGFEDFKGTLAAADKEIGQLGRSVSVYAAGFDIFSKSANDAGKSLNSMAPGFKAWGAAMKEAQTQTVAFTATTKNVTEFKSSFTTALSGVSSEATKATSPLKSVAEGVKNVAGAVAGFAGGAIAGVITGIGSAAGKAATGLLDMGKAALGAAADGLKTVGGFAADAAGKLISLGIEAGKAGLSLATGFAKDSVKVYTDFSQKISGIAAVAGATSEELEQMSQKALELGAKFPVSASQAADAMANLASAGFKAKDAIGASDSVVLLATAGQLDMAKSADILSSSMNGFGLITSDTNQNVKEAARVTDLMAATANASAVSIQDIGATMKYVAPVAKAAGYSIEDMSVAIGMMGNAGIKGSSAGTALRSIITRLNAPTAESAAAIEKLGLKLTDATGKTRPFADVIGDLRTKFAKLSQTEKIDLAKKLGGQEALAGLLSMVDASPESFKAMQDSIDGASGAATDMAKVMSDNLNGKLQNMQGSVETLQIKFGKALAPAVGIVYDAISNLANRLGPFADSLVPKVTQAIGRITTVTGEVVKGFDIFKAAFSSGFEVPPAWEGITATMGRLGTALAPLKQAVGDLVAAILPAAAPANAMSGAVLGIGTAAGTAHPVIDAIAKVVTDFLVPGIEKAAGFIDLLQLAFGRAQTALAPFLPTIESLAVKAFAVYQAVSPLNNAIAIFEGFMQGGLAGAADAVGESVVNLGNAFGINLAPAVNTVQEFIKTNLIPGIEGIVTTVSAALPKIISFGQGFLSTVLPPIQSFVGWISTNVGPVVQSAFDTFTTTILPALGRFADFFGTTVIPKVSEFVSTIADKVKPILETGFSILTTTVIPTIGKLVAVITDDVIPILFSWWSIIATVLSPVFDTVVGVIQGVFLPAIQKIWGFINDPLIPIFKKIADVIKNPVIPALQTIADFFNKTVKAAIDTIVKTWDGFTQRISDGASAISKIFSGDLTGAANDMKNAVAGRTNEAGASVNAFADVVKLAGGNIKTDLTGSGGDWSTLNQTVTDETLKMDTRITDFSINTRDEATKTTEKVSGFGQSIFDMSQKASNAAPKVDTMANSMTNSVAPGNNAKTAADGAAGSFGILGANSDTANTNLGKYNSINVLDKTAVNNFAAVASAIGAALANLQKYNATPVVPKTAPAPVSYASGTSNHPGGPAIFGDDRRGPELVKYPSGSMVIASAPTYQPNMPAGTKVYNGPDTAGMLAAPATRGLLSGRGNRYSPAASGQQIYNSNSNYTDARQNILNVQSMRSTENLITDFGILEVMS